MKMFPGIILLHLFFLLVSGGSNDATTAAPFDIFSTTYKPIRIDPANLENFPGDSSVSPELPMIHISSSYSADENVQKNENKLITVTGIIPYMPTNGTTTSNTSGSTSHTNSTTPLVTTSSPGNTTMVTGVTPYIPTNGTTTSNTTRSTSQTNSTTPLVTTTSSEKPTTNGTTFTATKETTSGSPVTGETSSVVTNSTASSTTHATPTAEPHKLSHGAVAAIVIGCLFLISVIVAAVVFFIRNRYIPPEAQRLRP